MEEREYGVAGDDAVAAFDDRDELDLVAGVTFAVREGCCGVVNGAISVSAPDRRSDLEGPFNSSFERRLVFLVGNWKVEPSFP
jgi:hypothetical protein